jgi:hypothetical protein
MRRIVLATVVSSFVMAACGGPQIPAHNGYKSEKVKPWKNAKKLSWDEKSEAKAEGDLSYSDMRRAKWYLLDLPSPGELTLKLEITPPGDAVNEDFDMAMEILDPGNRVISKADSEEEDVGELTKTRTLYDLPAGKYLLHLYLQGRMDSGDFMIRATYKSSGGGAEYKSDFPAQVAFLPPLPTVPIKDDTPIGWKAPTTEKVVIKKGPRGPAPPPTEKKPPPPPAGTEKNARIINISVSGSNANITIGIGTDFGVAAGWKGKIAGINGTFTVGACNPRTCTATVAATPDQIKAGGSAVTLTP